MLKPARLKPGDTIGIISPSWGGAGKYPPRVEHGRKYLETLGYRMKLAPHALNRGGYISDTPEHRAADVHAMFAYDEVSAIIAAIGGDHSCHLLPLLDFDLIRAHPKIFMGFSDVTVLDIAIWQRAGLVTFYGPALLTDFAEYPRMQGYSEEYFLKAVTSGEPVGRIEPSPNWTETRQEWGQSGPQPAREMQPSPGWTWLKEGRAEGHLVGGCLESLQHLRGTPYWPDWAGAIFFVETSEDHPTPATVDSILMDYENMGVFDRIVGMLVGRPMRYSDEEKQQLREVVLERTKKFGFPVIADMDFGHTEPRFTLPIGCRARIDASSHRFEILDSAVT